MSIRKGIEIKEGAYRLAHSGDKAAYAMSGRSMVGTIRRNSPMARTTGVGARPERRFNPDLAEHFSYLAENASFLGALIGWSTNTLQRWDREGRLRAHRSSVSNRRFYTHDQYLEYLGIKTESAQLTIVYTRVSGKAQKPDLVNQVKALEQFCTERVIQVDEWMQDIGSLELIAYEGEHYLTVTEVARRFNISRGTCYSNLLKHLQACYLPGRKNALYRQSEVEQFSAVRIVVVCQQSVS